MPRLSSAAWLAPEAPWSPLEPLKPLEPLESLEPLEPLEPPGAPWSPWSPLRSSAQQPEQRTEMKQERARHEAAREAGTLVGVARSVEVILKVHADALHGRPGVSSLLQVHEEEAHARVGTDRRELGFAQSSRHGALEVRQEVPEQAPHERPVTHDQDAGCQAGSITATLALAAGRPARCCPREPLGQRGFQAGRPWFVNLLSLTRFFQHELTERVKEVFPTRFHLEGKQWQVNAMS